MHKESPIQIQRVSNYKTQFESSINEFGTDDNISQARRIYIRERLTANILPFLRHNRKKKRLEEYELKN